MAGVADGSRPYFSVTPPRQIVTNARLGQYACPHCRALRLRQIRAEELLEFQLLVLPRSGANGMRGEFGIEEPHVALGAGAAWTPLIDSALASLLAGRSAQIPERQPERRAIAQVDFVLRRVAQSLEMRVVDIGDLGHEKEGSAPTRAVNAVVLPQKLIFRRSSNTALDGQSNRRGARRAAAGGERLGVERVQGLDEFVFLLAELIQNRPQQQPLRGKDVTSAV